MRNSARGAQFVRKPSESSASVVRPRPPAPRAPSASSSSPAPLATASLAATEPRWSGSIQELAASKQRARSQLKRPDEVSSPAPGLPDKLDPPGISTPLSEGSAAPSARSLLFGFRRQWNRDRQRQIPCWLASFVLHLLAVVLLGSLTVPVSRQRTVVALLMSFGEVDGQTDDGPVELATTVPLAVAEASPDHGVQPAGANQLPLAMPNEPPSIKSPALDGPTDPQNAAKATPGSPAESPGPHELGQISNDLNLDLDALIDTENEVHDEIVERFIEFDVGRLPGAAGLKARQDFDRLGTEAIGSLIRGLNKSAMMQASCPVVVISQKLGTLLRDKPEPALLQYALANIGRDVPSGAPHMGYLQALVAQIQRIDRARSAPNVPMIVASLKSRDVQGAIQATNVVVAEYKKLADLEKRDVAWALVQLLKHRDADLRSAAHAALVALAGGEDYGPASDRRPPDRVAAACRWSLELCPDRFEAAANSTLKTAENLAGAGKGEAARRCYRKLVHEYAGTEAADQAAERLKGPTEFASR
jgi:hypothetical protein